MDAAQPSGVRRSVSISRRTASRRVGSAIPVINNVVVPSRVGGAAAPACQFTISLDQGWLGAASPAARRRIAATSIHRAHPIHAE